MSMKNDNKILYISVGSCSACRTEKESIKGLGVSETRSKTAQTHKAVAGPSEESSGGPSGDVGGMNRTFSDAPPGKSNILTKTQKRNLKKRQKKAEAWASATNVSDEGPTKDDSGRKRLASELTPWCSGFSRNHGSFQTTMRSDQETLPRFYYDMDKTTKLALLDFPTHVSDEGPTKDDSGRKRLASELTPWCRGINPNHCAFQTTKRPRQETLRRCCHAIAKTTKLAVVKVDFPTGKLKKEEADKIQIDILNRIDKIPDGEHLPVITSTALSGGAVMLSFEDKATEDWIRNSFKRNTSAIEGIELKVLAMDEMPKPVKVAFKTKDTITGDPKVLLKRLQRYNPELKTDGWRVRQRLSESESTRWIFDVDLEAAEAITKAGFSAFTGLDKGSFKILFDPNTKKNEEEEGSKDAIVPSPSKRKV